MDIAFRTANGSLSSCRPATGGHVHPVIIDERNAFRLKEFALGSRAAKDESRGKTPVSKDHAVAGNLAGTRVRVQRKANVARFARLTNELGNLPIRCDHTSRNLLDHLIDPLEEAFAGWHLPRHEAITTSRLSDVTSSLTLIVAPR